MLLISRQVGLLAGFSWGLFLTVDSAEKAFILYVMVDVGPDFFYSPRHR